MSAEWSLSSHKSKFIAQDVNGIVFISVLQLTNFRFNQDINDPNPDQLSSILSKLEHLPPLVMLQKCALRSLTDALVLFTRGLKVSSTNSASYSGRKNKVFLLHTGNCVEIPAPSKLSRQNPRDPLSFIDPHWESASSSCTSLI
ncbi:hypothetical protein ARMGADRAFT_1087159 [Armillaria gallica]|uniref:Uncharacterized protein n=1 Tax=Armillaria gallica TaxID=47427 RepID=A0A2H3D9X7_ARMGA|nr:hypothetical protein ARMGADRAFT_1087159 [Armillaria gallica]